MKLIAWSSAALMFIAGSASAVTVNAYDESISGDASRSAASAEALGALSVGGDEITIAGTTDQPANDTRDVYSFSSALDFDISLTSFAVSSGVSSFRLFTDDGSFSVVDDSIASVQVGSGTTGSLFGVISAGDYIFWINENSPGVTTDYALSITALGQPVIAAVPVPAGMPLLLGGLGALAWMRRRKKA